MTKDEILAMGTGKELDNLVLKEVMGEAGQFYWKGSPGYGAAPIRYSTDISAAWQVVKKLAQEWQCVRIFCDDHDSWFVNLEDEEGRVLGTEIAIDAAPEAISKAALLATIKEATNA